MGKGFCSDSVFTLVTVITGLSTTGEKAPW